MQIFLDQSEYEFACSQNACLVVIGWFSGFSFYIW